MRSDDVGAIAPGQTADLCLIDLDTLAFTPLNDIHRQLVYCENGSSVRLTMIDGRIVFSGGRVQTMDERSIREESRQLANDRRAGLRAAAAEAEEWHPAYRQMYLKAAAQDLGINRWIGDGVGKGME